MSCSDIKVTIVGDVADVMVLLDEIKAEAAKALDAVEKADQDVIRAQTAARDAEQATANVITKKDGVTKGSKLSQYNFTGAGVDVTRTAENQFEINIPGTDGPSEIDDITGLKTALAELKNTKIDEITSEVDPATKSVSFKLKAGGNVVHSDTVDLSPFFGGTVQVDQTVYFGFSTVKPPIESAVKSSSSKTTRIINGLDITITRTDADFDLKYMFVWVPDVFGEIEGFKFGGTFLDVWQSFPLTVDSIAGKVYVSDNQTRAQSVSFEVKEK